MDRVSGASESGAARPLPYPNPGRGRVTVNGLVTQPQTEGAEIGPTSITTHGFISGGGGACADSRSTVAVNTRLQAKTRQAERKRSPGLDTGNGVLDWDLHEACRGDPRVIRGSVGWDRWTADEFATRPIRTANALGPETRRAPHTPIAPFGAPIVAWVLYSASVNPCRLAMAASRKTCSAGRNPVNVASRTPSRPSSIVSAMQP